MLEFGYEIIIVARDFNTCPLVGVEKVTCIEYDLSDVDGLPALAKDSTEDITTPQQPKCPSKTKN